MPLPVTHDMHKDIFDVTMFCWHHRDATHLVPISFMSIKDISEHFDIFISIT